MQYRKCHAFKSHIGLIFFSGLIFTTDQVVIITARIAFVFASLSAVHLCDFRTQYKEYYEANGAEVELTDGLEI